LRDFGLVTIYGQVTTYGHIGSRRKEPRRTLSCRDGDGGAIPKERFDPETDWSAGCS